MKFWGITAICCSISSVGLYFSYYKKMRYHILVELSEFFSELSYLCSFLKLDTVSAIESIKDKNRYQELTFLSFIVKNYSEGADLKTLWYNSIKESREWNFIEPVTRDMLLSFSRILGKRTLADFTENCGEYCEYFRKSAEKLEKQLSAERKFFTGMSILTAAAVFIILI